MKSVVINFVDKITKISIKPPSLLEVEVGNLYVKIGEADSGRVFVIYNRANVISIMMKRNKINDENITFEESRILCL